MHKRLVLIALIILALPFSLMAEDDEQLARFKKYINLKSVGSHAISPDGNFVVFLEQRADWKENDYRGQIWLANVETGQLKQMTFEERNKFALDWMPGSKYFTFKMSKDGTTHLYKMAIDGGGPQQITEFEDSFGGYSFTKDGSKMIYSLSVDEDEEEEKEQKELYGSYHFHDVEYGRNEIWLYDFETDDAKKLIGGEEFSVSGFSLSPDETKIAYFAQPDNRITNYFSRDLMLYDMKTEESRLLVEGDMQLGGGVWSPDSTMIAYSSGDDDQLIWFKNNHIMTINIETGEIKNRSAAFDESISPAEWREDGIYFIAIKDLCRGLYRINTADETIVKLTPDDNEWYSGFSFSSDADVVSFTNESGTDYSELHYASLSDFQPVKLTSLGEQVKDWTLATKEKISWESTDGTTITGVLTKPADYDPEKKYPLLVIIHGGPTWLDYPQKIDRTNGYAYPVEEWAAKGAVILEPNYRGSAGFGEEFRGLNYRNLGVGDYWDVISGVDHLIEEGIADPERLGSMGWSQGGYISAFITTFSDRFKAVSVGAGISDWVDYYYRTDITPFTIQYLGDDPWDDPEVYDKTSPMAYIKQAQTPTLIQHGERDARVPINNAYKLFRGLEDQGVPVYFAIYHGFGHSISNPKERLAMLVHNWNFFNKYVWGEDVEVMTMPGLGEEETEEDSAQEAETGTDQ